jgi:hypothetical protein
VVVEDPPQTLHLKPVSSQRITFRLHLSLKD